MNPPASGPVAAGLTVRLPRPEARDEEPDQDQEWCELVHSDGTAERLRFHDYDRIFSVPGRYEQLFYEELECNSPVVVRGLLENQLERAATVATSLCVHRRQTPRRGRRR